MPGFLAEVLTWPSNHGVALAVQTAMDLHMPPSMFILTDKQPTDPWTQVDKKLALAWTVLQRETCKQCGQPLWICRSSERDLGFSVRTDVCYASAELEKWKTTKRASSLKKGEHPYVVAQMRKDEQPMPTRKRYLLELSE